MQKDKANILIIGLGQIGYSDAEYMTWRGLKVDGYDINANAVQRAIVNGIIRRKAKTFEGYDYYVVCVSTHKPENMFLPSFDGIYRTADRLYDEGKEGALVAIESTITKGVSDEVNEIIKHSLHVAHVPHRFYANEKTEHGVRQIRVLGGCETCCTDKAAHFYKKLLDIPVHVVSSVELAEISKVVENSYRYLEIAFAEELKMFCDGYKLDFDELRVAINTKWNVDILEARKGISGHCLPKDTRMYFDLARHVLESSMIDTALVVEDQYKLHMSRAHDLGIFVPTTVIDVGERSVELPHFKRRGKIL